MNKAVPEITRHRIQIADGATTIHVVSYNRRSARPKVVLFDAPTRLLDWCEQNNIINAINGGFFGSVENGADNGAAIGEVWIDSVIRVKTLSEFDRGCIYISKKEGVRIGPRSTLPEKIDGDLLEAGPLLLSNGKSMLDMDREGFSAEAELFDNDVRIGRAQRVAVACDNETVWFAVSEGRSDTEAGLTLGEMAEFLQSLGAKDALNLDGGSGSSLVINQKLINKPRMDKDKNYREFPRGREIVTAFILDQI